MPDPQIDPQTGERVDSSSPQIDPQTGERMEAAPAQAAPEPGILGQMKANFNAGTQGAQPGDNPLVGALKNVGAGGGDKIRSLYHTIQKSIEDPGASAIDAISRLNDVTDPIANFQKGIGLAKNLVNQPARTIGNLGTGAILADTGARGFGLAGEAGTAIRNAAIGDTDAAALRGLQVGPKSPKSLSTLSSIEGARPYLQGAKNLEDLQGRIQPAKDEIFSEYNKAVQGIGDRPVKGPDGMTTVRDLENERLQLSALNRGLKTNSPEAIQLAQQKGMTQAQLLAREKQVQNALDPELESTGIDPKAIRKTFGQVAQVGSRVSGKSTLIEPSQPTGFGRIANLSLEHPLQAPQQVLGGIRDLVAGRPMFGAKPTDLGINEGFRNAGPKPNLGRFQPPQVRGLLDEPEIQLGASPEVGGTPPGYRPPPFYHDTDAMRTGRLLKAPPIQLGGKVEGYQPPPVDAGTTATRFGRLLGEPVPGTPMSSHTDIFPDQLSGGARRKIRIIEGQR